jgi:hypothetical protein
VRAVVSGAPLDLAHVHTRPPFVGQSDPVGVDEVLVDQQTLRDGGQFADFAGEVIEQRGVTSYRRHRRRLAVVREQLLTGIGHGVPFNKTAGNSH